VLAYLALLALAQPYKKVEDLYLACISTILLMSCFLSGIAIKLCEDQGWEHTCEEFLGLDGSYQTYVFVVAITVGMLLLLLAVIVVKTAMTVRIGTICLASTGRELILDLPTSCNFHCFLSHAWRTGQDQTHTIVRQLQLLIPGIKIWLDVDNLSDVGKLEECVMDSAVFVIFLSAGYFRSVNCRRELYTALAQGKPVVAVREEDQDKGGATVEALKQECLECCTEQAPAAYPAFRGPAEVIERVLSGEEPIVWVRVRDFQLESLKCIAFRMVRNLPYYTSYPQALERGLKIAGELAPCALHRDVRLLVCSDNTGVQNVAEEVARENTGLRTISIQMVSQQEDLVNGQQPGHTPFLLLYLNDKAFLDSNGTVGELVKQAMDLNISIIPVHEQDAQKGGCGFGVFFDQTPQKLLLPPYKIWDTLAIPLYPAAEHRKISLRHILNSMGARPSHGTRPAGHTTNALHSSADHGTSATGLPAAGNIHPGPSLRLVSPVPSGMTTNTIPQSMLEWSSTEEQQSAVMPPLPEQQPGPQQSLHSSQQPPGQQTMLLQAQAQLQGYPFLQPQHYVGQLSYVVQQPWQSSLQHGYPGQQQGQHHFRI